MSTHLFELDLIRQLHTFRNAYLDAFFIFCNFLDSVYFSAIVIVVIWVSGNRNVAVKTGVMLTLSWALNKGLKYAFLFPRPFHLDLSVGVLTTTTPGFPSGAAQTAVLLCGILILEWRSPWRWVVGPLFALVLCFSRVYLGLHFPTDIVGGILVGFILLGVYCLLPRSITSSKRSTIGQ